MRASYDPAPSGSPDTVSSGAQHTSPVQADLACPPPAESGGTEDAGDIPDRSAGGRDGQDPRPVADSDAAAILDQIRIATVVLDLDGRVVVWAPSAAELTGHPAERMLGARIEELFPVAIRDRAAEQFRRVSGGADWVGFLPVLRADGRVFDVGFRAVTQRFPNGCDLVQVVATDAADLRRVEGERVRFETLFGQVPAGIAIYDAERRYVRVNPAFAKYDGVPVERHPGLRAEEIVEGLDPAIPILQQQVLDTGEPVVDLLVEHDPKRAERAAGGTAKGRGPFWSMSYARLQSPNGEVLGLTGVVVDVTERQLALERGRLARRRPALLGTAKSRSGTSLDEPDTADDFAARAAASFNNAYLHARERSTALMLQRWLLPEELPDVEDVRLAHRYRPGSPGADVGGDWFDVIPLPGRRVALVVGDVMGSGLRVAGIMGQFRTAARTLARLDLSPAVVLRELDELARSLGETHIATCVYVVYDAVAGRCVAATAGHLPPIIADPGGAVDVVELAPGTPLGVGRAKFEEREFPVEPGAVLVLYTDGLVEDRDRDASDGIDDLIGVISKADPAGDPARLEGVCDAAFDTMLDPQRADDATLLVAALDRFPQERVASWVLTSRPTVAAQAREMVRRQLGQWADSDQRFAGAENLGDAADVVELLVSELVTNALRYGRGPIGLRLLLGEESLVCEVADELEAAPRLRTVDHGDEGGRGLHLVDQLSTRGGIRSTVHGTSVWFELGTRARRSAA
jgi:PAS domain S-box-containing protein